MSTVLDLREQWLAVFGDDACPQWVKTSIDRYISHGIPTGDFLRAVLCNDLMGAFARADIDTARAMPAIVGFVHRNVPRWKSLARGGTPIRVCGNEEAVDEWIGAHIKLRRVEVERENIDREIADAVRGSDNA